MVDGPAGVPPMTGGPGGPDPEIESPKEVLHMETGKNCVFTPSNELASLLKSNLKSFLKYYR